MNIDVDPVIASLPRSMRRRKVTSNNLVGCLHRIDHSLKTAHRSMSPITNPVIQAIQSDSLSAENLKYVLSQYCYLPCEIVGLLTLSRIRLSEWLYVSRELTRNIAEERGSRTGGRSHFSILQEALLCELDVDISESHLHSATQLFLNNLQHQMARNSRSYVLGMVYGLENSAVPELVLIAKLINELALKLGQANPPIDLAHMRSPYLAPVSSQQMDLNSFFAMHLVDFEVGHKTGLIWAIQKQRADTDISVAEMEFGFEFVLDEMDRWWDSLATEAA